MPGIAVFATSRLIADSSASYVSETPYGCRHCTRVCNMVVSMWSMERIEYSIRDTDRQVGLWQRVGWLAAKETEKPQGPSGEVCRPPRIHAIMTNNSPFEAICIHVGLVWD